MTDLFDLAVQIKEAERAGFFSGRWVSEKDHIRIQTIAEEN